MPYPGCMDPFAAYRAELKRRDLAPSTRQRYSQVLSRHQEWLETQEPSHLLAQEFLAHLREKGYQPWSLLLYYHALQGFFTFLGQPLKLRLRKPRTLPKYYDVGDIERLVAQARRGLPGQTVGQKRRNTALVLTLAFTGMRRSEVLGLRVADIDLRHRLVRVRGKGDKERTIPIAERLMAPLWEMCQGKKANGRVFIMSARSLYRVITRLARRAGLEGFHPHSLRHYFATRLVERGSAVRVIQELLGHADLSTTAVYLDVVPRHLRNAVSLRDPTPPATTATG